MSTLADRTETVQITGVRFTGDMVYVTLSDGREVGLPLSLRGLRWLANASPEERAQWEIGPAGQSVNWWNLQDGIEVQHLLKHGRLT